MGACLHCLQSQAVVVAAGRIAARFVARVGGEEFRGNAEQSSFSPLGGPLPSPGRRRANHINPKADRLLGEIRRRVAQNGVGPFQLAVFLLQRLESFPLITSYSLTGAGVTLCLAAHLRGVSAEEPIFSATEVIVCHWEPC